MLLTNGSRATTCRLLSRLSTSLICSAAAAGISYVADSVLVQIDAALVSYSPAASFQFLPDPVITSVVPERGVYRSVCLYCCSACWFFFPVIAYISHMYVLLFQYFSTGKNAHGEFMFYWRFVIFTSTGSCVLSVSVCLSFFPVVYWRSSINVLRKYGDSTFAVALYRRLAGTLKFPKEH